MIPIWLTPRVIKGGILGIVIMAIFFAGWGCKGKLVEGKIQRMRAKVQTVESNYDLCLADVARSQQNYEVLREAIEKASADALAANAAYQQRVEQMRVSGRAAISQLNALHDAAIDSMADEADDLRERMAALSADEACNLAMVEIVK